MKPQLPHVRLFRLMITALALFYFGPPMSRGEDWPSFRHDSSRSATTKESLAAEELIPAWTWQSPHPPQPAWAGPAKWDAYARIRDLSSMRDYDLVFHVAVVGESLYFGSSLDDSVRCLDTKSGEEKWRYVTDGPVRIAPEISKGKVYFGSDDGYAYCLRAETGKRVWRFNPNPNQRLVLHNGRMISFWPIRTGVLVRDGNAYFAASMLPWRESFLCAVSAATGKPKGKGRYVRKVGNSSTFEGVLLLAGSRLVAPQGRVAPLLFDRATGNAKGQLDKGGGGCFAVVTPENRLIHGPGNRRGQLLSSDVTSRAKLAVFPHGKAMVVTSSTSYLLESGSVRALDRKTRKALWKFDGEKLLSIIVAGETVFVGRPNEVVGINSKSGKEVCRMKVNGKADGLAVANGQLFVSTDQGAIHCFRPATNAVLLQKTQLEEPAKQKRKEGKYFELAAGPLLQFTDQHSAVVRWETKTPTPTVLEYSSGNQQERVVDEKPKLIHEAKMIGLKHKAVYSYVIKNSLKSDSLSTKTFECDNFFNYSPVLATSTMSPFGSDKNSQAIAASAEKILHETKIDHGVCLVLGNNSGQLAYEIAMRSQLRVTGIDTDRSRVAMARKRLENTGLYGGRVSFHYNKSLEDLPFPSNFANLIIAEHVSRIDYTKKSTKEIKRLLRPDTGVAFLHLAPKVLAKLKKANAIEDWEVTSNDEKSSWLKLVRGPLSGTGDWTHQYGNADNAAFAGEKLNGAVDTKQLTTQWLGRPGPRFHPDRNGRKPGPLSASGRLFAQGLHRIVAVDAFNGTILWSAEIPEMIRMNIPRDSSNWCADEDFVYAAIQDRLWQFDAATGARKKMYNVIPGNNKAWQYDWSFVASHQELLVGSAVKKGTAFTEYTGGGNQGWYDAPKGTVTHKVCSENLFALDKKTGEKRWEYANGLILNPTITLGKQYAFFVECRNTEIKTKQTRRLGGKLLWKDQFLVALDIKTGRTVWEQAIDTHDGETMFSMAFANDTLTIVASGAGKFHVYAYDSSNGKQRWHQEFGWPNGKYDHGKAMSRPAIVGDTLYVRPMAFNLATGKVLSKVVPGGGCGTYACTENTIIFRSGNVTMWDSNKGKSTSWSRLRPGCWLSTIPASGMLLSPEAGGGCSCGNWLETTIVLAPKETQKK